MSGAPEGLVALMDGIGTISPEILQRRVTESHKLAALARAVLPIQQRHHKIADCRRSVGPE
jgi:hypothetical protein